MKTLIATSLIALAAVPALAQEKDWRFGDGEMPERWSTIDSDYAICDAGLNQSPIDLGTANARGAIAVIADYGVTTGTIALGPEKVQVDLAEGQSMQSADMAFNLLQVHFHTPAEHAFDGKRHPLVAHFVHATDDGTLGVLGVMFEEGAPNPELAKIVAAMEDGKGTTVSIDTARMIPSDLSVYRYMGSLTTPPCSEGVNWHVAKATMTASAEQIAALGEALGPTARSIQPLGNRLLVEPTN